jgi:AcrR family transcriptional regulator
MLTDAASALIAEKGVSGLRIQEITDRADVALGSFYNHFGSKDELVEAVVADTIDARAHAIVARMAAIEDPAEVVSFACRRVVRIAYEEAELAWLFVNLDRANVLFEAMVLPYWQETLEHGLAAGRFEIAETRVTLTAVVGGVLAVMRAILEDRHGADADALFAEGVLRSLGLNRLERELLELDAIAAVSAAPAGATAPRAA